MLPSVCVYCLVKQLSHLPKKPSKFIYTLKYQIKRYQQNVSWPHFSWPTL